MPKNQFQALKKSDLTKRGNDENLVNKFFHQKGMMNIFLTDEGQFVPEALVIVIDGEEVDAYEADEIDRLQKALDQVKDILQRNDRRDGISFTGRFSKTGKIHTAKITKLLKTEEFGGKGPNKVNAGNLFEKEFEHSLQCKLQCLCKRTKYDDQAQEVIDKIRPTVGRDISLSGVIWAGPANQKRTLVERSGNVVVNTERQVTEDIGPIITDITTYWGGEDKNPQYLSLKWGNTLTFINSGVGKVFPQSDFDKGKFTHPIAKSIFNIFGINQKKFLEAFKYYPHKESLGSGVPKSNQYSKLGVETLLKYAVGYNYWMIHGHQSGKIECYKVDKDYMKESSSLIGGVEIFYGGKSGKGKRVDIVCESSLYKFTWNIRNKQSGTYPTHIMCDYVKK